MPTISLVALAEQPRVQSQAYIASMHGDIRACMAGGYVKIDPLGHLFQNRPTLGISL